MPSPSNKKTVVKSTRQKSRPFLGITKGGIMAEGMHRDKSGNWVLDKQYLGQRIFERTYSTNKSVADRLLARYMVEVEEGRYQAWKRKFEEVTQDYLDKDLPEKSKHSQTRYEIIVRVNLLPFFKGLRIGEIIQFDQATGKNKVMEYFEVNGKLPESSLKKHARVLKDIIKRVVKDFKLPAILYRNKGFYQTKFLREHEMLEIVGFLEEQYQAMAVLMAYTGLRLSNALRISWKEIDLKEGFIRVVQSKTGERVNIPICSKLMEVLRVKNRLRVLHDDRLFHHTDRAFQKAWKRARESAGYEWARVHDLRHFFCSYLLNEGIDHMAVATLSGHKSIGLLKERYGHYEDDTLRKAMSVFDKEVESRNSSAV
jgi:integrase